jgi:hypothetical protein
VPKSRSVRRRANVEDLDFEQLSAGFERYFQRGEMYAVLNVTLLAAPRIDARDRRRIVDWANQPRVQRYSKRLCVGSATVVARAWERHALTAIQWLWTPPSPLLAATTVSEGLDFCVSCLVERAVPLPTP